MLNTLMKIIKSKPAIKILRVRIQPDLPEWDADRDGGNLHNFLISETGRKTMSTLDHTLYLSAFSPSVQTETDRGMRLGFSSAVDMIKNMGEIHTEDDEESIL
jgi:hypothetical protein